MIIKDPARLNDPPFLEKIIAVLFHGNDEEAIAREAGALFQKAGGENPFCGIKLSGDNLNEQPGTLGNATASFSLSGEKQIILLSRPEKKQYNLVKEAIEQMLGQKEEQNLLIILSNRLDARDALKTFFEGQEKCASIPLWIKGKSDSLHRLSAALKNEQKTIRPEAFELLQESLGEEAGLSEAEINKILTFATEKAEITSKDIALLFDRESDLYAGTLIHDAFEGKYHAVERGIETFHRPDFAPIMLLRLVSTHIRQLEALQACAKRESLSLNRAVERLAPPVFFKIKPRLVKQASLWDDYALNRAQIRAFDLEKTIRTKPSLPAELLTARFLTGLASHAGRAGKNYSSRN